MLKAQPAARATGGETVSGPAAGSASSLAVGLAATPRAASPGSAAPAAPVAPAPAVPVAPAPAVPAASSVPAALPSLTRPAGAGQPDAAAVRSATWQANLARLEGLAEVLNGRGLRVRLMTPPGRVPSLHVVNPGAVALAEDVYAGRGQDGTWWFWWSWAERITVGEDLEGAASMIEHVLAARPAAAASAGSDRRRAGRSG